MKLRFIVTIFLTALIPLAAQVVTASTPQNRQSADFGLGRRVGSCLIAQCEIFSGQLLSANPKSGEPVVFRIQESVLAVPEGSETIEVPYSSEVLTKDPPGSAGFGWLSAHVSPGAHLVVVLARGQATWMPPGWVVRVVDENSNSADLIRSLARASLQLTASPDAIGQMVDSLSTNQNPALAGYLYDYLSFRTTQKQPDVSTSLLGRMIGCPSVPPETWDEISMRIVSDYHRLKADKRSSLVQRFTELAQDSDRAISIAGFRGLQRLAKPFPEISGMIPPAALTSLASSYKELARTGLLPHDRNLEAILGISPQTAPK